MEVLAAVRGTLGGLISSACCLGSLILLLIGAGNLALAASIGAYRTYFILAGVAFVLLSIASHLRKRAKQCACSYKQLLTSESRFIATTITTFAVIFGLINFAVIPFVTASVSKEPNKAVASAIHSSTSQLRELKLKVDDMTCESCAEAIEKSLLQVNGVVKADVSYAEGIAVVVYDPSIISQRKVVESVPEPYSVKVLSEKILDEER